MVSRAKPYVTCIIVNYRTAHILKENIDRISSSVNYTIIVDNASPNNDYDIIEKKIGSQNLCKNVLLIASPKNGGFSYGNNLALKHLPQQTDYVYFLNPDTRLNDGAVSELVNFMEKTPKAGVAGSRLESPEGQLHRSVFNFPTITREFFAHLNIDIIGKRWPSLLISFEHEDTQQESDWVAGASMLVRRSLIDEGHTFDQNYFLYYEEVDFMLKIKCSGWTTWYVPNSVVMHLEGEATGISKDNVQSVTKPDYWYDSWRLYYVKNFSRSYAMGAALARIIGCFFAILHRSIRLKSIRDSLRILVDSFVKCLLPLLRA